jgi:tetratricopeptide (TPR) repeat protein
MLRFVQQISLIALVAFAGSLAGCKEVGARRNIQEGNKAYYRGDYDKAIVLYNRGLAAQPDLDIGWFNLGLAHLALFSPGIKAADNIAHATGAIEAFQKYLAKRPNDTQARDYLLSTYIDSGRYEGAIEYFEQQLARNGGKDLEALGQLAQINSQAGNFDKAIEWHKKKAEVETTVDGKADSWYSIGVMQWRRLNNHPEVVGEERLKIADEGIAALVAAGEIRKDHSATLSYENLLYRERGLAHGASWARAVEVASAQVPQKRAIELNKAAATAPQAPPKPGSEPKKPN